MALLEQKNVGNEMTKLIIQLPRDSKKKSHAVMAQLCLMLISSVEPRASQ